MDETTRIKRSQEKPLVPLPPNEPGIRAAMALSPQLDQGLRVIAEALLVSDFPGASISRFQREVIATAVSYENGCVFCSMSHAAFARALAERGDDADIDYVMGGHEPRDELLVELVQIAKTVARDAKALTPEDVEDAIAAGATDADVQLAILIASSFAMFNRMVDGLRAPTSADPASYEERGPLIAEHGYIRAGVPEMA